MTGKFNVDGRFTTERPKEQKPQLPAHEPEILPPATRAEWKPRPAEEINVPSPVMRRSFFGHPDHAGFQKEVREVDQSERAVTTLIKARTEKEKAVVEHERALARRELMPALIEQDQLSAFGEVALARAALRRSLQHINRQHDLDAQAAENDRRLRELEHLEYETELARKQRVLAEEKAKAGSAEQVAAHKAEAAAYEAEQLKLQKLAELEKAQRKVNLAKGRRIESEFDEDDAEAGVDSPHLAAALRSQTERGKIKRDAEARRRAVLDRAGAERELTDDDRYEIESITQAEQEALKKFDISTADIRFDGNDEESE